MPRRPSRRAVARGAIAGIMVLPAIGVVATAAGARSTDSLYVERKWDAVPGAVSAQNARVLVDDRHRIAYAFFTTPAGLTVRTYDVDKRRMLGALPVEAGVTAVRSQTPIALDEARGLAVLAPEPVKVSDGADRIGDVPVVKVYAAKGRALTKAGQLATRFPPGYIVLGLTVDAARSRLLIIAAPNGGGSVQTVGAGVGGIMLDSWKMADLAQGRLVPEFTSSLRVPATCGQLMSTLFPADLLPSTDGKSVYFGCLSNRGPVTLLGPNAGDVGGVARLNLQAAETAAPSALRIRPISGNYAKGDTFALPRKGRFVLLANDAVNTTIKVYDATHDNYVGNVGLDKEIAAIGFDPASGRGYYVNDAGFGVFDVAATPVNQGVVYPELAPLFGLSKRSIEVDPKTHRVYVPTADDVIGATDPWIAILKDGTPLPGDDDAVVEDGLDVAEQARKYESSRTVDAGALGAEFRMVGGPNNLIFNTTHFNSQGILTRPGTRWLQIAATRSVRMTPDEASAQVVTMRTDDATASDLDSTHFAEPVLCTDFGAGETKEEHNDATVICDTAKQKAEGIVSAEPGRVLVSHGADEDPVPAQVVARQARSSVDTFRDTDGTLVSVLHAEATGIDIMGAVQIGRVVADGTVKLRGRTGTASTTYERRVQGLVVNGTPVCDNCPLDAVGAAIEEVFGGRVLVSFPEPHRYAGPRGQVAGIADNPYRHVERATFDEAPEDVVVTPAMEIVVFLDGTAPSRLVVDLAAISAQARYKIFKVGTDEPEPTTPPAPPTLDPETPGTVDGGSGGTITTPGEPAPKQPTIALPTTPNNVVAKLVEGMKIVFRSPRHLAAVVALWSLLALPTYLAARRRLLLDLPFLRRTVEES